MTRLINSLAEMTDLRDRDELEVTLASVMFDLIGPTKLALWRLVIHMGQMRLRQRALITSGNGTAIADTLTDIADLPALDSRLELRACYDSRAPLRATLNPSGQCCHVFPVNGGRQLSGLLEIQHSSPLREYQERLVSGLLRIYNNHLRILDYSEYDELTDLLNRKTFDDYFRALIAQEAAAPPANAAYERIGTRRLRAPGQHPWLAVIDIDFFKRINDRFGHLYGDEVLVLLARLMRNLFRDTDRIFRFGGEEFVVIIASTEAQFASDILERCRKAVESFAFPQVGRVSVSIGYTLVKQGDSGPDAFGRADKALYIAKQNGRNQVRSYEALIAEGILQQNLEAKSEVELF